MGEFIVVTEMGITMDRVTYMKMFAAIYLAVALFLLYMVCYSAWNIKVILRVLNEPEEVHEAVQPSAEMKFVTMENGYVETNVETAVTQPPFTVTQLPFILTKVMLLDCFRFIFALVAFTCCICLYWTIIRKQFEVINAHLNQELNTTIELLEQPPYKCADLKSLDDFLEVLRALKHLTHTFLTPGCKIIPLFTQRYIQNYIANFKMSHC